VLASLDERRIRLDDRAYPFGIGGAGEDELVPGGVIREAILEARRDRELIRAQHESLGGARVAVERLVRDAREEAAAADHAHRDADHDERHDDDEKEEAQRVGLVAVAEVLELGDVSESLPEAPDLRPDEEEDERMDDPRPGSQEAVDADADLERLPGAPHEGERRHRRPEDRHEEHEWADAAAREEVVARGAPKQPARARAQDEEKPEVEEDDDEGRHFSGGLRLRVEERCRSRSPRGPSAS